MTRSMTLEDAIDLMYGSGTHASRLLMEPEARPLLIKELRKHVLTLQWQVRRGAYTREEIDEWITREINEFNRIIRTLQAESS